MNNTSDYDIGFSVDKLKPHDKASNILVSDDLINDNSKHILECRKNSRAKPKQKQENLLHILKTTSHELCINCFENKNRCICHKIEGYDPYTGYAIVSISEEEWDYINQKETG